MFSRRTAIAVIGAGGLTTALARADAVLAIAVTGGLTVVAAGAGLVLRNRDHLDARHCGWRLLSLALIGLVVADMLAVAGADGASTVAAGWLAVAAQACAAAGLFLLVRHRLPGRADDILFEALTIAAVIGLAAWTLATGSLGPVPAVVTPLLDVVLLWLAVRLVLVTEQHPAAYRYLLSALVCAATVDTVAAAAGIQGWSVLQRDLDMVTLWSWCLWAVASVHPSLRHPFDPVPAATPGHEPSPVPLTVCGLVAGPALIALEVARGPALRLPVVLAASVLIPALVVLHLTRRVRDRLGAEHRAQHDPLTGLPNQVLFHDRLAMALAQTRRTDRSFAVVFLDLDRFKGINDSLGHVVGDQLLQAVAKRLGQCLREQDTVARIGGDEFALLLPGMTGPAGWETVAGKILAAFAKPLAAGSRQLFVTPSLGVAVSPDDGTDVETLLKHADTAMYQAKARGGNSYQRYTADMSARAGVKLAVENSLRAAIEHEELEVHYQPKIDLVGGRIVGVEALARWRHPKLGFVSPGAFIPLAEETGLIHPLGEWVLEAACAQNRRWMDAGFAVPVAVNLSARQFEQRQVDDLVARVLRRTGLPPDLLELEITESVFMQDVEATNASLGHLQAMGVRCSLDDFGTGFSGLHLLAEMPIDTLKIDRSFVQRIRSRHDVAPIVAAVIALAHSLGMQVVAEGVETDEQAQFLRDHGCEQMQGFLFSHPLPAADVEALLRRSDEPIEQPSAARPAPMASPLTSLLVSLCTSGDHGAVDDEGVAAILLALRSDERLTPVPQRLWRSTSMRVAAGTVAGLVPLSGGLAAAGALPAPVQNVATELLSSVGLPSPGPRQPEGRPPADPEPAARPDRARAGAPVQPVTMPAPTADPDAPSAAGDDKTPADPQHPLGGPPAKADPDHPSAPASEGKPAPEAEPAPEPATPVRPQRPLGGPPGEAARDTIPEPGPRAPVHPQGAAPGQGDGGRHETAGENNRVAK